MTYIRNQGNKHEIGLVVEVKEWCNLTKKKGKFGNQRDNIERCFEDIGGRNTFKKWALQNQTSFYTLYAKTMPKETKVTTKNETHEDFIKIMMEREQKRLEGKGKPLKLIEVNGSN